MLLGDFNEIVHPYEVLGGPFSPSRANLMSTRMSDCDVMDMDIVGGLFTFSRNTQNGGHVRKKLDRCMSDVNRDLCSLMLLLSFCPRMGLIQWRIQDPGSVEANILLWSGGD